MSKFVSYLRVSTQKQGRSGLGLEAQREAVRSYLADGRATLLREVIEVESGKRSDRVELAKALALCRLWRARLLVAKIDRLARDVHFISTLMKEGVEFVAVDLPEANHLTVHIMAAMAEHEAKAISDRTKSALAAAKARGVKLGVHSHRTGRNWSVGSVSHLGLEQRRAAKREKQMRHVRDILPVIVEKQKSGLTSLRQIAAALNAEGFTAPSGGQWHANTVRRVLQHSAE